MLQAVSSILRQYNEEHSIDSAAEFPIRTKLLHPYIEERGVVDQINIFEADIQSEKIVALIQKYKGQSSPYSGMLDLANIYYAKNFNVCWRRFGVCKEMYHCMIDRSDADRTASIESLQTLLELLATDTTAITGEFPPFEREQEAEFLAVETLFPVEYRQPYIKTPPSTHEEYISLANKFRIPVRYVFFACQPSYVRNVTQLRGRLLDLK